jgi:type II secretory pathway predicted ATPase ExeA
MTAGVTAPALTTWGLSRAPFEGTADPEFYFPSEGHAEALARLEYLARDPGTQLGLLTGELGCGKSLVRALFAARSAPSRLVGQLTSSHYPWTDLLRDLLGQLGAADFSASAGERELVARLQRVAEARRVPVVLLFDEAQELSREALVGVRALTNLADGRIDLKLVLVGQPELRRRVLELPQLDQRAGLRYHLLPLDTVQIASYLEFRLRAAGHPDGALFAPAAAAALAAGTRGVPREINRVARLALAVAASQGASRVDEAAVRAVLVDLERQRGGGEA